MFPYPVINCEGLSNLLGLLAVRLNELETALIYKNKIKIIRLFKGTLSRVDMRRNFHSRGISRTRVFVGRHYGIVGKCIKFAFILHLNQIYV